LCCYGRIGIQVHRVPDVLVSLCCYFT